ASPDKRFRCHAEQEANDRREHTNDNSESPMQPLRHSGPSPAAQRGKLSRRAPPRFFRPVLEVLEDRFALALALTPAGVAAGFSLSTFATGFPPSVSFLGGPVGIAFPNGGGVLVADDPVDPTTSFSALGGTITQFPTSSDGQTYTDAGVTHLTD